jgi:predicted DNA-binding protein
MSKQIKVGLPADLRAKLEAMAKERGATLSGLVRLAIERMVKEGHTA